MIDTQLKDGRGAGTYACITKRGELVVGPADYSTPVAKTLTVADTAVNFFGPRSGKQFVVTGVLIGTNKDVGVNGADVFVYEAATADTTTVSVALMELQLLKNDARDITGLNVIVGEGKFVNAKSDDTTVFITVLGYYVTAEA
jgi:hypothetical protein